jgi:hypothetical protein
MSEADGMAAAEALAGKLARYSGPAYRKAYLANLMESGKRFLEAGNARGADYCFAKVAAALPEAQGPETPAEADSAEAETESEAQPAAESAAPDGTAQAEPRRPRAPRSRAKERPLSPTDLIRLKWRQERLRDAEAVLNRNASRLSALEQKSYRDRLDKLKETGSSASGSAQSDKADAGLLDLRRRLYGRVLKSQKLSLKSRHMPVSLARLALPPADRAARPGYPAVKPAGPVPGSAVRVDPAWQPATGPYNDRYNMEDLLTLIADADPAWVEEFLDLYRGLSGMQILMDSIAALKK